MNSVEYRAWINIPNLPYDEEDGWGPLLNYLEKAHGQFGPVMGWDGDELACVVMATEAETPNEAAQVLFAAVTDGIRATALDDRYPSAVKVEVAEDEPVPV